ncbi:hypothetical protein [Mammaliicoccus sciuri]|uniref:hypothetical protein n=1 Tax=Mammaliicoccus sciuri TaxID=1296 RepID=UPI0034DD84F2
MKPKFYEIFKDIFPYNISDEQVKKFLYQFKDTDFSKLLIDKDDVNFDLNDFKQGDIFNNVPMSRIDFDFQAGFEQEIRLTKAMIISNSCDIERRNYVLFAPIMSLKNVKNKNLEKDIKQNIKASVLYLGNEGYEDECIVLEEMFTLKLETFNHFVKQGNIFKLDELNQYGYYLLLAKISHFLVRPESKDVYRYD